ncbi:Origin recognition complex, subunit 3 [Handroanthus impetiginosus]|uniref:Origin recognition complex, subunit 3 n=1 Tax=Handroanthus impetiginosus TaxID=429701 RepID=A0A2G9GTW6_9LAMI|nr:Origin recognition complex, subunit 3 [Handroanthus impetiginosus]
MALEADPSSSPSIPTVESNLQPFFVLHKASQPRKSTIKARRKIDLSPKNSGSSTEEYNDSLRLETFQILWSNTESIIKDVMKNLNAKVFDEIDKWVHVSFDEIRDCRKLGFTSATRPYPILNSASIAAAGACSQIFTALLFTKNMEFVDDILTFADLGVYLRSHGCYVANLTSLDFSAKSGVGGCLKTLLRQFLMVDVDAPDMSILASWFTEQENCENPLVVIIDDVERCCGSVLADFIIMLREWAIKIPIILILGVATTFDALRSILCSRACSYLSVCEFTLGTPAERMDAVIDAVLLKNCESFSIGKQVSTFLRNYFLRHDGTLTLFFRALRIAMARHIYAEPLSFILRKLVGEEGAKGFDAESTLLRENLLKRALDLPSLKSRCFQPSASYADWDCGLSELKKLRRLWSSTVMCLYEVGKYRKMTLLDSYCEMLKPELCNAGGSDHMPLAKDNTMSSYNHQLHGCPQKECYVVRILQTVRDLPSVELSKLLNRWEMLTRGITEIHEKVKELQSQTTFEENRPKRNPAEASKRPTVRNHINEKTDKNTINKKVAAFLQCIIRQYIHPIENVPYNEIVFFDDVDKLETALIGDPRRRIQADLLESHKFLKCSCCGKNGGVLVPSMHDTSIMYSLAQEHGDLINLHEWFHSFKAVVSQPVPQAKKRLRQSPSPKKRKRSKEPQTKSDASIQAEFCRAVTELQITGLIRMLWNILQIQSGNAFTCRNLW